MTGERRGKLKTSFKEKCDGSSKKFGTGDLTEIGINTHSFDSKSQYKRPVLRPKKKKKKVYA